MKKILSLMLLVVFIIVPSVFSWGATRSIAGNDVTIEVDVAGTYGYIVRETIPPGLTVTLAPDGYIGNGYVRWTFLSNSYSTLTYSTTGSGTISGSMFAGDPASEKPITGDTTIPAQAVAVCGNNIKEASEVCDGTDLAGATCLSQGFAGGQLVCTADCSGYDASGCTISVESSLTIVLNKITAILSGEEAYGVNYAGYTKLQKISAVARALKDFFSP